MAGTADLEDKLADAETTIWKSPGCRKPVELWSVKGGGQFVAMGEKALDSALSFLEKSSLP